MTHHVPLISGMTLQNFREINEVLTAGQRLEPTAADHEQVIHRALDGYPLGWVDDRALLPL